LKILLTEVYASEYPKVQAHCLRFKQMVYDGEMELDELDPYVMVYRRLEEYLRAQKDPSRLELVRRCLYIKVNLQVTKQSSKAVRSWRQSLMEKITNEWRWDSRTLLTLDTRRQWKIHRVLAERKALVNELNYSYRFLSSFAKANRSYALINQQDMNTLGRKLYAAFERKSGKIEKINPKIAPDISEDYLSLFFSAADKDTNTTSAWVIYPGQHKGKQPFKSEPIKRASSVIEVLAWCYFNKILEKSTRFVLNSNGNGLTDTELRKIIICFARLYPKRHIAAEQQAFSSKARDETVTLLINIGIDPMKSMSNMGVQRISDNTDALRYSGLQTNLVLSLDQISVSTWKEVVTSRFSGENAIIDCIVVFLRNNPPSKQRPLPELDILCFCATKADTITQRVEELFKSIINCFYNHTGAEHSRYIVEIGNSFYVIQLKENQPCVKKIKSYGSLVRYLSQAQQHYSRIVLDKKALEGSTLAVVSQNDISDVVQVFYMPRNKTAFNSQADVFILDEKGSLFSYTTTSNDEKTFIPPMFRFIQSALNRQNSDVIEDDSERQCEHIMFYEIVPAKKEQPIHAENKGILRRLDADKFYSVQAIVEHSKKGEVLYTIFCNHKEFSQLEHGSKIFEMAAKHILSMRPSRSRYPIYITDLDLSHSNKQGEKAKRLQISQYMTQKQMIESRLNEALFSL
ncbi:MAG: class I adenylate cyclase, partial [Pseudomonadales bacterium]|nr:class I adenylate cyclase [Pseudomonadales bacterium]